MNYRTILLATAAVMFAGAANAEDITAPMYLPGAGKVLSNTSLQYERTSLKHNAGAGEDPIALIKSIDHRKGLNKR